MKPFITFCGSQMETHTYRPVTPVWNRPLMNYGKLIPKNAKYINIKWCFPSPPISPSLRKNQIQHMELFIGTVHHTQLARINPPYPCPFILKPPYLFVTPFETLKSQNLTTLASIGIQLKSVRTGFMLPRVLSH